MNQQALKITMILDRIESKIVNVIDSHELVRDCADDPRNLRKLIALKIRYPVFRSPLKRD